MARRKLLTPDERQALLDIPDDEESLFRWATRALPASLRTSPATSCSRSSSTGIKTRSIAPLAPATSIFTSALLCLSETSHTLGGRARNPDGAHMLHPASPYRIKPKAAP
jgi:hypothetical protein